MRVTSGSEALQWHILLRVLVDAAIIWQTEGKANFLRRRMLHSSPGALRPYPWQVEESNRPADTSTGDSPTQVAATRYTLAPTICSGKDTSERCTDLSWQAEVSSRPVANRQSTCEPHISTAVMKQCAQHLQGNK